MSEPEWITIADAAQRLGMLERTARRWAAKLPADGRRQEDIGNGKVRAIVRLDLFAALVTGQAPRQVTGQVSGQHQQVTGQAEDTAPGTDTPVEASFSVPLGLAMTAQRDALERVMQEKERVISEQAARICDLQTALDHERWQSQQLTEALAREQTLRLLSAPEPAPETPPEATESSEGAGASAAAGPYTPTEPFAARLRAFWKRHWY